MSHLSNAARRIAFVVGLVLLGIQGASAAPIISTIGTPSNGAEIRAGQANLVRWTLTDDWTNVSISASLATLSTENRAGKAYLMSQVGPGTTLAQQLAFTNFNFQSVTSFATLTNVALFSGLSLAAGDYFLVFGSDGPGGFISFDSAASYSLAAGVSVGVPQFVGNPNLFTPSSIFSDSNFGNRFFTVSGDRQVVPEPASLLLVGLALCGLVGQRVRRRLA